MQLLFLSGSKRLLWSEIQRFFSLEHAAVVSLWIEDALERVERIFGFEHELFFSLDRRGRFRALSEFSASNMQLFFLSGSKTLLWSELFFSLSGSKRLLRSEIERFFSLEHAAVFRSGSKRLLWAKLSVFGFKHGSCCFSLD